MPEIAGSLQSIETLRALPLLVLVPLFATAVIALLGPALARRGLGQRFAARIGIGNPLVTVIGTAASLSTFAVAVHGTLRLAALAPSQRYLYAHLGSIARWGSADIDLGLALDPLSAVLALTITAAGIVANVWAARSFSRDERYAGLFASLQLLIFASLLVVVAADLVTTLVGFQTMTVASFLLMRRPFADRKHSASPATVAFLIHAVGDVALVGGILLVLFGLGGSWLEGGAYQPDNLPRLSAVRVPPNEATATGTRENTRATTAALLTMTSHEGAKVFLEDTAAPFATAPFSEIPVPVGDHTLRVATPGRVDDELPLDARAGTENVVVAMGPTLSYRELYDQLALTDARGRHARKVDWASREVFGGVGLVTAICVAFFLAAAAKSALIPFLAGALDAMSTSAPVVGFVHAVVATSAGVYLLARLRPLFAMTPTASAIVAFLGGATALVAALASIFQRDLQKVLAYLSASQSGLLFVGLGVGAHVASTFHLAANAVAQTCLWLGAGSAIFARHEAGSDDDARDLRAMGGLAQPLPIASWLYALGAATLAAAPFPLLLGFGSKTGILWQTLQGRELGATSAAILYALLLAASVAVAFGIWRSYFLAFQGESSDASRHEIKRERALSAIWLVILVTLSVVGGVLLGGSYGLSAAASSPIEMWLAPVFAGAPALLESLGPEREQAATVVAFALFLSAFFLARRRYGSRRRNDWAALEERFVLADLLREALYVDVLYSQLIVRPVLRARTVLCDLDEWVIGGWVTALAFTGRALANVVDTFDRSLSRAFVTPIADGVLALGQRTGTARLRRAASYLVALFFGALLSIVVRRFFSR